MSASPSVVDLAGQVQRGEVTASELVERALTPHGARVVLAAFVALGPALARASAAAIDSRRRAGEPLGPLAGVPIAIKDALCTVDQPTTAGSAILRGAKGEGYRPPYDATVVARLRAADAVLFGKTNMDEFAMGSSGENSAFGPTKNPHDPTRAPGGSSSGSAVAVAAGIPPGSLGSDTGGSVRQPAAFTGCVGLKPTYGRVSRYWLIAFASSLDQVGPFASDVRGAGLLLDVIAGADPKDETSAGVAKDDYVAACDGGVQGLTVGVPEEYFGEGLEPEVAAAVRGAIAELEARGARVAPIHLPHTAHAVATYYVVATAECSSNLARFDGVRYGERVEAPSLDALYGATRTRGFGAEVKRRIMLGTYVLSAGYYEAYYLRAQKVRTLIARDFAQAFASVDVIATPTAPTVAFPLGSRCDDPLSMYLADVYTLPASLAGLPAISLPCGSGAGGLPVGLQLIAPAFGEARLMTVAAQVEAALGA